MSTVWTPTAGAAASPAQAAARESYFDEALIRQVAAGDQSAMRPLFGRHRVAVYRWLLRLVGDVALAEDLLSEVFLAVWRQAASFDGRSSVSTWLLAIARKKALATRRGKPHDQLASIVPDLRHALARLSREHGEVIDLVYYHRKSMKEVSEIVGIDEATVKARMFNARKKLAELVASA
jgi:RNA polymerase sigma-70 factor, ECF subfamily